MCVVSFNAETACAIVCDIRGLVGGTHGAAVLTLYYLFKSLLLIHKNDPARRSLAGIG